MKAKSFYPVLLILLAISFSSSVFASDGEELKLVKKPDGRYGFGVTYAYDVDFMWLVTLNTTISSDKLSELPANVKWNILDKKSGKFLSVWNETPKSMLKLGQLKISDKNTIRRILPKQADIELVFGVQDGDKVKTKYYLPIGDFCTHELSDYFKDLTNTGKRCDQIKESDIPNEDNGGGMGRLDNGGNRSSESSIDTH